MLNVAQETNETIGAGKELEAILSPSHTLQKWPPKMVKRATTITKELQLANQRLDFGRKADDWQASKRTVQFLAFSLKWLLVLVCHFDAPTSDHSFFFLHSSTKTQRPTLNDFREEPMKTVPSRALLRVETRKGSRFNPSLTRMKS